MPLGLSTDLYELTMAAGYVAAGKVREKATFELFVRRLPPNRNFLLAAGLAQAVEYLLNFSYTREEINYLRGLSQFHNAPSAFFDLLSSLRFTGDLWAVPEGTPVFPNEPLLIVRAPLLESQIPETHLLATIAFQTMIASKAARVVEAAGHRAVVEFGTRRAHSPEAGRYAARASYIGGCIGTSNTDAGFRYDLPVYGTAAHSWTQSFCSEPTAFRCLQELLGDATVYLVDTYDTLEGTRRAAALGRPLWGVRLDSGDLADQARSVRRILDHAGLNDAKIMASGDLNEYRILELMAAGAPIDAFGVGTDLATSADAPTLGAVYKLVEVEVEGIKRYTTKLSHGKQTLPGAKQVFRYADHDLIGCSWECPSCPEDAAKSQPLLRPVIVNGELIAPLPTAAQARDHARGALAMLPSECRMLGAESHTYRVEYSEELLALHSKTRALLERRAGETE